MQTFFCCPREGQIARGRGRRRARSSKRDKNGGKKILENCCLLPSTPTLQPLLGGPSTNAGPCCCCRGLSKRTRGMPKKGGCCYCGCSPRRASVLRFLAPKHEDEKEAPSFFIRPRRRPLNSRVALRIERRTESSSSFKGHSH